MSRNYTTAQALTVELIALAEEKGSGFWKTAGLFRRASLLAATGKNSDAVSIFSSAIPRLALSRGDSDFAGMAILLWRRPAGRLANSMTHGATLAKQ